MDESLIQRVLKCNKVVMSHIQVHACGYMVNPRQTETWLCPWRDSLRIPHTRSAAKSDCNTCRHLSVIPAENWFPRVIFLLSILFYSISGMQQRHLVMSVTLRGSFCPRTSSTQAVLRNNSRMEIVLWPCRCVDTRGADSKLLWTNKCTRFCKR